MIGLAGSLSVIRSDVSDTIAHRVRRRIGQRIDNYPNRFDDNFPYPFHHLLGFLLQRLGINLDAAEEEDIRKRFAKVLFSSNIEHHVAHS